MGKPPGPRAAAPQNFLMESALDGSRLLVYAGGRLFLLSCQDILKAGRPSQGIRLSISPFRTSKERSGDGDGMVLDGVVFLGRGRRSDRQFLECGGLAASGRSEHCLAWFALSRLWASDPLV